MTATEVRVAIRAVSFDFGQTLATIDVDFLAEKLTRFEALRAPRERYAAALGGAWSAYDEAVRAGLGGHPWRVFMRALLEGAIDGADPRVLAEAVEFLWLDQPRSNLWRQRLPEMIQLVEELRARGVPYAILSNSEGKLRELLDEMELSPLFPIVADSGVLGVEKPDKRIFDWVSTQLGVPHAEILHIGDSLGADVMGALGAGYSAVWFRPSEFGMRGPSGAVPVGPELADRAHVAANAADVRAILDRLIPPT
ncbi:MAG: HAD family hydrolase [Polyangiaceae bacterium]